MTGQTKARALVEQLVRMDSPEGSFFSIISANLIDALEEFDRLTVENERLREYATHKRNCNMMSAFIQGKVCTCEFNTPAPDPVQEAAKVLLEAFTSEECSTDFKPAWEAYRKATWALDGSIYDAQAAFLRALSGDAP